MNRQHAITAFRLYRLLKPEEHADMPLFGKHLKDGILSMESE